jgi:hypothetical protein
MDRTGNTFPLFLLTGGCLLKALSDCLSRRHCLATGPHVTLDNHFKYHYYKIMYVAYMVFLSVSYQPAYSCDGGETSFVLGMYSIFKHCLPACLPASRRYSPG